MANTTAKLRCPKHDAWLTVRTEADAKGKLNAFARNHQGCGPIEAYEGDRHACNLTFPASQPN
jgi:hypothetical protein